jgi:hypothetical protein
MTRLRYTFDNPNRPVVETEALPCPRCNSTDLEINQNVVVCMNCDFHGHDHSIGKDGRKYAEYACDWREAVADWNYDPSRGGA